MLKSLDYAIIGIVAEKRNGLSCSKQFISCLSYVGTISKISSIYQFTPESLRADISNQSMLTHICFSLLLQLKDAEDWGSDFGLQIEQFAQKSADMTSAKNFEAKVLDFRSQFSMCKSVTIPYPDWIDRPEFLFPSLEIIPESYVHPVLNEPLSAELISVKTWKDSEFLQTGRSLIAN
jgi:7,8-dihydro-6-hydroxymethylpterin-pyrophosphokinase